MSVFCTASDGARTIPERVCAESMASQPGLRYGSVDSGEAFRATAVPALRWSISGERFCVARFQDRFRL